MIEQLWNNTLDYYQRYALLRRADYKPQSILSMRHFFCQWHELSPLTKRRLERAEQIGKYKNLKLTLAVTNDAETR